MKIKAKTLLTGWNLVLLILLVIAFVIRVYRVDQLLGFYFDQGRDALVIWDLWHKGKFFLIGPTTGIAGIFRGPFYYYLIAPFYLFSGGNPVFPAVFLSLTTVVAIYFLFPLGRKILSKETGIFAVIIATFSYRLMMASRWLSNPTPMLLLSVVFLWSLFQIYDGKKWAYWLASFIYGLSLFHFGSAGEVFYLFPLAILVLSKALKKETRKQLPDLKTILLSGGAFLSTVLPLVLFDFKHHFILSSNIRKFLLVDKSFALPTARFIQDKLQFFYEVFSGKLFLGVHEQENLLLLGLLIVFLIFLLQFWQNRYFRISLGLFLSPLVGLIFFQGNFGSVYDYYLTGYYLVFVLLVASSLGYLWRYRLGKLLVIGFFYFFLQNNIRGIITTITDKADDNRSVAFVNQKKALDWVYQDAGGVNFNVDVYVPPVIPYAYDYLFAWYGGQLNGSRVESRESLLYTLYEVDPPYPERLEAWLARQKGIGKIIKTASFGGITVERRERL